MNIPEWPPEDSIFFVRAAECYNAWKDLGVTQNFAIAMMTQAEFESAYKCEVIGDHHQAFNCYQWHWSPRGEAILKATGIDVRTEKSIKKIVEAAWWELNHTHNHARETIEAQQTLWSMTVEACKLFEGAGAPGAAARRAEGAVRWFGWISTHKDFIDAHPAA